MTKLESKLFIADERMLELMDFAMTNKLVESQKNWCIRIGFNYNNLAQIRSGRQGFTDEHKLAAVEMIGANMNWLFGLEDNMIRMTNKVSGLELIKQGVRMLEKKR